MVVLHLFDFILHHLFEKSNRHTIIALNKIKTYIFTLTNYAVDAFTPPPLKKSTFSPIFSDFFRFSLMVLFAFFHILLLSFIIIKCEQNVVKKNTKKKGFSFSTLYFIFRKWTKINVQKSF